MARLGEHPAVADSGMAAIGYCFGGSVVMNMALSGMPLEAAISFHGVPTVAVNRPQAFEGSVRIHNGAEDGFVARDDLVALARARRRCLSMSGRKSGDGYVFPRISAPPSRPQVEMSPATSGGIDPEMIDDPIGFLEPTHGVFGSPALLIERFRVPFATLCGEEVASVDMDRRGQARNRVDHRVDDVRLQRRGITGRQCLGTRCLDVPLPA